MDDKITKSIIVKAEPTQAFGVWENFENFPMFMKNIKSVTTSSGSSNVSQWMVAGPLGKDIEWSAEVTTYEPNKRIGWSTKDREGDITTSGQVTFNALPNNETEVTVTMHYVPKGGKVGEVVAGIFANPEKMLEEDLRNYKSYVEGSTSQTGS